MRMFIPQLFTLSNLLCGFLALHYAFQNNYVAAAWLVFLGAVLDKMDGTIARRMGKDSIFGIQLDSLADVCTFGFVPAVIIYQNYLESVNTVLGLTIAFSFLLCGTIRLARFNTLSLSGDKAERYYLGLPIPTAAICLTQFSVFERSWQTAYGTPIAMILVLWLAFLMISRLDYDSVPNFRSRSIADRGKQIFFIISIGLVVHESSFFFPVTIIYTGSGLYRWIVGLFRDEIRQHA